MYTSYDILVLYKHYFLLYLQRRLHVNVNTA